MDVAEFGVEGSVRFFLWLFLVFLLDDHFRAVHHYFKPSPPLSGGNFDY